MKKNTIIAIVVVGVVAFGLGFWAARWDGPAALPTQTANILPLSVAAIHDTTSTLYKVDIEYPQFPRIDQAFNEVIANEVSRRLDEFKKNAADNWQARQDTLPAGEQPAAPDQPFYFSATWSPKQLNPRFISFVMRFSSYEGGANAREELKTFNYDVENQKEIVLAELFPGVTDYLTKVSNLSRERLAATLAQLLEGPPPVAMINEGTKPTADNFRNFVFDDNAVQLFFAKYQVAPGAAGEQTVFIGRGELK